MTKEVNLYGPPGSGKTTRLIQLFIWAAKIVGPDQVAAVTYTKTAADELRLRAAVPLGLPQSLPSLRKQIPWVDTIHSLKFKLLGLSSKQVATSETFLSKDTKVRGVQQWRDDPYPDDVPTDEDEMVFWIYSVARARMMTFDQLLDSGMVSDTRTRGIMRARARYLIGEYEEWKIENRYMDFDDMLTKEARLDPPVQVLLADECQDNSPLLWSVLDKWGARMKLRIHAGDPYQAIYSFAGAEPSLFRKRESLGKWVTIGNSRRFGEPSAEFAREVLRPAFGEDPILRTWRGEGPSAVDGTELVLARTHNLIQGYRRELIDAGTPFRMYHGKGPLQTTAGEAYRTLHRIREGDAIDASQLIDVIKVTQRLPKRTRDQIQQLQGDRSLSPSEAQRYLGRTPKEVQNLLPNAEYFRAVLVAHGIRGLFMTPKLILSTIHGAKGREADRVTLLRSWGTIPAQALTEARGTREEACVAYVAVTRHRQSLQLVDVLEGQPYPFPRQAVALKG
jgi:superfamily I DNA/RNA helicase